MTEGDGLAVSRRHFLAGGAASLVFSALVPRVWASGREPRFLLVILRGGVDGLAVAAPVGDPLYTARRGPLAIGAEGEAPGRRLDGLFLLNPAMKTLHGLYEKREALILHAVATPYRERSHFDGQDILESGLPVAGRAEDGWLNRALAGLGSEGRVTGKGLAMGAVVPLAMRGMAPVLSWLPRSLPREIGDSTLSRLLDLYSETDPKLAKALAEGIELEKMSGAGSGAGGQAKAGGRAHAGFITVAEAAAKLMAKADGPRIGVLSYDGWDTHANEGVVKGRLYSHLEGLDHGLKAFSEGMGVAWRETVVAVVTEFGRTVRVNGTLGTDHGVGGVAMLLGGAVNGGRVIADWPGLADKALYEGRDLRPTLDLRAVFKGVLQDHLGMAPGIVAASVFPESGQVKALGGLVRNG